MSVSQYLRWLVFCALFIGVGVLSLTVDPGLIHKPDSRGRRAVQNRLGGVALCGFGLGFAMLPILAKRLSRQRHYKYTFRTALFLGACVLIYGIIVWAPVVLVAYPPDVDVRSAHIIGAAVFWIVTILGVEVIVFVPW